MGRVMDCFIAARTTPGHWVSSFCQSWQRQSAGYSWGCDGRVQYLTVWRGQQGCWPLGDVSLPSLAPAPERSLTFLLLVIEYNIIMTNGWQCSAGRAWHNISISHDTLPLSQDCQIFCSKLVNSLQQSQSIARADGSHLIKCLLITEQSGASQSGTDTLRHTESVDCTV